MNHVFLSFFSVWFSFLLMTKKDNGITGGKTVCAGDETTALKGIFNSTNGRTIIASYYFSKVEGMEPRFLHTKARSKEEKPAKW